MWMSGENVLALPTKPLPTKGPPLMVLSPCNLNWTT